LLPTGRGYLETRQIKSKRVDKFVLNDHLTRSFALLIPQWAHANKHAQWLARQFAPADFRVGKGRFVTIRRPCHVNEYITTEHNASIHSLSLVTHWHFDRVKLSRDLQQIGVFGLKLAEIYTSLVIYELNSQIQDRAALERDFRNWYEIQ
jgi:hypothetical protein